MNRWKRTAAVAALLVLATAGGAWAAPASADIRPIHLLAQAEMLMDITANRPLPDRIRLEEREIQFDQAPLLEDGTLMLPLRAVVEVAGGKVTWEHDTRTVTVRIGDRTATFVIGEAESEMNQDGVRYLQRNMLKMERAPMLAGGRTLVSADSLSTVLGLMERPGTPGVLTLVRPYPASPGAPVEQQVLTGTIKEVAGEGEKLRILIEGGPMANGEPSLLWAHVGPDTQFVTGSRADLKVGRRVELVMDGAVMLSYPAQAGAAEIRVLD